MDKFNQTSDIALILTSYGGHVGFIEGLWPTKTTYADKVCIEFLRALLENRDEISQ